MVTCQPRSVLWPGQIPRNSNGTPRPLLAGNRPYMTVHYTGVNVNYGDPGDTPQELKAIQTWAQSVGKPWEYNWVADSEGVIWEYAGLYQAAHSAGENHLAHGLLVLAEVGFALPDVTVTAIRKLRYELVQEGHLSPNHSLRPHKDMPGAATGCPGGKIMARWAEISTPWTPPAPPPPTPPAIPGGTPVFIAVYANQYSYLVQCNLDETFTKHNVTGKQQYLHLIGAGVLPLLNDRVWDAWLETVPEV